MPARSAMAADPRPVMPGADHDRMQRPRLRGRTPPGELPKDSGPWTPPLNDRQTSAPGLTSWGRSTPGDSFLITGHRAPGAPP